MSKNLPYAGRALGCSLALAASLALFASSALAQPAPPSQLSQRTTERIDHALDLRRTGHDREALAELQAIYRDDPSPNVQAQIAFAEQALGRWLVAEMQLSEAMAATTDPWIQSHRGVLDSSLAEIGRHLGGLDVLSNVASAVVLVDGRVRGRTPLARPIRVEAGTLNVEVRAEGHTAVRRTVEVTGGASTPARVSVDLVATAVTPTVAPPTRAVLRTTDPAPTPPVRPRGSTQRTLAWASAVGAAVFVGTGVVAYVVGSGAAADWNNDTMCQRTTTVTRGAQCPGVDGTAETMQALSLAGFIGGSALAVASVVLFATAPGSRPREHAARFGCGVGPTALGMACGGTF